ncbi:MAG: hypothetical protein ACE5JH_01795 [Acidobacteriota bacterium]
MGVLATIAHAARIYPALLPLAAASLLVALWAHRRKAWLLMGGSVAIGAILVLLHTGGSPAGAAARLRPPDGLTEAIPNAGASFSSTTRLHPRFPGDFPIPSVFLHEHSRGGRDRGALTLRFRFKGDPRAAVSDLAEAGARSGWEVEAAAPHRLVFTKDVRRIEAWFGFPGRSLVLDVPEPR